MIKVQFKKLHPDAQLPRRAYNSNGYDLYSTTSGIIPAFSRTNISLGFASDIEPGYAAIIDDRGSLGNRGLTHLAGVIDSDFRGEWIVIMQNLTNVDYVYSPEKAIAQVLFLRTESISGDEVTELDVTVRGSGMLGSSGH